MLNDEQIKQFEKVAMFGSLPTNAIQAILLLSGDLKILKLKISTVFDVIKHGDNCHQQWLKEKLEGHFK